MGRTTFLALILLAAGCADRRDVAYEVEVLPSGTRIARNGADGSWTSGERWRVEEEFRIGSLEAGDDDMYGFQDVESDASGRSFVLFQEVGEVRLYDDEGAFVRRYGRKGRGPGELWAPMAIDLAPDGRLWITEPWNKRYTVLDTASGSPETIPRHSYPFMAMRNHDRIGLQGARFEHETYSADGSGSESRFFRVDSALIPVDTVRAYTAYPPALQPFRPRTSMVLSRTGNVWFGTSDRFRFARVTFDGDTTLITERPGTGSPVTKEVRDAWQQHAPALLRSIGAPDMELARRAHSRMGRVHRGRREQPVGLPLRGTQRHI